MDSFSADKIRGPCGGAPLGHPGYARLGFPKHPRKIRVRIRDRIRDKIRDKIRVPCWPPFGPHRPTAKHPLAWFCDPSAVADNWHMLGLIHMPWGKVTIITDLS